MSPSSPRSPQIAVRRHAEAATDWAWHALAVTLYAWLDRFNDRFFERRLPQALLSFVTLEEGIVAAYTVGHNGLGLAHEIALNTRHLEGPLWGILETLMHEYVHFWQGVEGRHPVRHNTHNAEFVARCAAIGLHPLPGSGVHLAPADGDFARLLRAYGVSEPAREEHTP
jgi:hypothetical protein